MHALILAAGFGTRLYPLTENIPKALVKIKGKPIIENTIDKINETEAKKIYIVSNNKFYINFLEWLDKLKKTKEETAKKIKIINNGINSIEEAKGHAVEIKNFLDRINIDDDLIVLACDNFFKFDINDLVLLSRGKNSSVIALKKIEDKELIKKYSYVLLNENNKITYFEEKPSEPKSSIIATMCYFLLKPDLELIKNKKIEEFKNIKNILEFLHKESNIYGKIFDEFWTDIGTKEELDKIN